jgi:hypothetical protein
MDITINRFSNSKANKQGELGEICINYYRKIYKFIFSHTKDNKIFIGTKQVININTIPNNVIHKVFNEAVKLRWIKDLNKPNSIKIFEIDHHIGKTCYLFNKQNEKHGYIKGIISSNTDGVATINIVNINGTSEDKEIIDALKQTDKKGCITIRHDEPHRWTPF